MKIISANDSPFAVGVDADAVPDEEVAVFVAIASDKPVRRTEDGLAARNEISLKDLAPAGSAGGDEAVARVANVLANGHGRSVEDRVIADRGGRVLVCLQRNPRAGVERAVLDRDAAFPGDFQV